MTKYKNRIIDNLLARKLKGKGAILLQGAKWCGKTTTAEQFAKSILYMDDSQHKAQNLRMAEMNMQRLLSGETPRLIDEWQIAPQIWDAVRFEVDHRDELGQFILTGSAVPADKSQITHSGTGRFSWLTMRPMSLFESGDSSGDISMKLLFEKDGMVDGYVKHELNDIAYLMCRGGWPRAISLEKEIALDQAKDYVDAVVQSDISKVDDIRRNSDVARKILRSYARHQGAQATIGSIQSDVSSNGMEISDKTISSYIDVFKQIFVIEDMPAWNPNLRSKSAIRTSDTRYFVDPSIATAAMGIGPNDLLNDLNTMGLLFETLCIRDLRIYAESLDGNVYHFRDRNGLECDAVVHLRNGQYGLIEIKLGGESLINDGIKTLTSLAGKIDTNKMPPPSFLMILTATGNYAYKREDGVLIVPIGCLKN